MVKILSLEKKKRERTIFCAGFILRNLFYLFERGEGEKEKERRGKIAHCPTKNIHAE